MQNSGLVLKYRNEPIVICNEYCGQISFEATISDSRIYYLEGNGRIAVDDKNYDISSSSLLLVPKASKISCSLASDKQRGRIIAIVLTEEIIWDYKCHFGSEALVIRALLSQFHKVDKEYITQFFIALVVYSQRRIAITEEILKHRIFEIIFAIENLVCGAGAQARETVTSRYNTRTIANHISVDLSRRKPIPEIAKDYGVSSSTLKRRFKKDLDMSLSQWLIMRRLEKVRFLIRRGKSIKEASFECGFCSSSYMIKMYRRRYGCTPKEDLNQNWCNAN